MKKLKQLLLFSFIIIGSSLSYAQQNVSGSVSDETGPLPGVTVIEKGTFNGVTTDFDGNFSIDASSGDMLEVSFLGYESATVAASNGVVVRLAMSFNELGEVVVTSGVIDVAKVRETPVAVSTISPAEISLKVGNLEFPEIMNRTPGVYATKQGGGYGDSRISLRGFDQRNTSFLINGQPVNDMENGWVYWSNWQGLTDVASGIQIQRGLGASRLAVPSVGGTVSIFTKAAELKEGGSLAQMIGNDGYSKTTFTYNSGKNAKGWASSLLLSQWSGDGYVYGTKGEGTTYFAAVGYQPEGSKHALNFSVLGAAQWHHQRSSWVSIRDYQNFGKDHKEGIDRRWNTDAGFLNGEEYNMRRNFYNKPLATFNWDFQIKDNLKLNTSFYGSAGRGGGTGPRGGNFRAAAIDLFPFNIDLTQHYQTNNRGTRDADGFINFDAVVAHNRSTTTGYNGAISSFAGDLIGSNGFRDNNVNRAVLIRRSSMNSHDWIGAISNLEGEFGQFKASIGVDLRSYKGYHYRVINDLMGLDGYYSTGNKNSAGQIINTTIEATPFNNTGLDGPKIDYFNNGIVGWQGVNGMLEYNNDSNLTAVLQGGLSNQSFQREDFFDQPAKPISDTENVGGGYIKGGANFNMNEKSNVFFNTGYISRQPQFDAVFPNFANEVNPDLQNEKITSLELGYGYNSAKWTVNANAYSTNWGNRFITRSLQNQQGVDGSAQFKNIDVVHKGFELEATFRPSNELKLQGMVSIGDWRYTKDFTAELFDANNQSIGTGTLYLKDAKVGDAAQFTAGLGIDVQIAERFSMDSDVRFYDNLYADVGAVKENLKVPSYHVVDFGMSYKMYLGDDGDSLNFRLNVNNLFDRVYINELRTNIAAEAGDTF